MDARAFFVLVSQMRAKQKEYFKTRTSSSLTESKRLEKAVDNEIARVDVSGKLASAGTGLSMTMMAMSSRMFRHYPCLTRCWSISGSTRKFTTLDN